MTSIVQSCEKDYKCEKDYNHESCVASTDCKSIVITIKFQSKSFSDLLVVFGSSSFGRKPESEADNSDWVFRQLNEHCSYWKLRPGK